MQRYFQKTKPKEKPKISAYEEFQKFIYEDMLAEWRKPVRLSYIITRHNLNILRQRDPSITTDRIQADIRKNPLVRETCISSGQIAVFPK
jgi:hypothetical protein